MVLKIEMLGRKHDRSTFGCGQESLDQYIRKQASQDAKNRASTIWVLVDEPETSVLAYYTLSSFSINAENIDDELAKKLPSYSILPATLLGRLAVDNRQKGKHLGELMLLDALKKALAASSYIASAVVVVEAIDAVAYSFYEHYEFKQFQQEPSKLYIPMQAIAKMGIK